jgi:hypothetical protein
MDRRQFLLSSMVLGSGLIAFKPSLAAFLSPTRSPLILHTVIVRPNEPYRNPNNIHEYLFPVDKPTLIDHGVSLSPGQEFNVRLIQEDMGHYLIGIYLDELEISRFDSVMIGGLMARGERFKALVTDNEDDHVFRIDVVLDRAIEAGERIPLLDSVRQSRGVSAQLVRSSRPYARGTLAGWQPVRALPRFNYYAVQFPKPEKKVLNTNGYDSTSIQPFSGLYPIKEKRMEIWNPTRWRDIDPAVAVLTQYEDDFAYLPTFWLMGQLPQLLLRGERIDAMVVGAAASIPGEVLVDLSLVA